MKLKKKMKKIRKKRLTSYSELILGCMNLGLKMDEIDNMDIGMMFDLIVAKNNMTNRAEQSINKNKSNVRDAIQEDFDRF